VCAVIASALAACRYGDMFDMPRTKPYKESPVFADGTTERLPPSGTVPRGALAGGDLLDFGVQDGQPARVFPFPVTEDVLRRGQGRFRIYCEPCHGALGHGDGAVERRGFFPRPVADLQQPRLRAAAEGYLFGVITNGYYTMPPYGPVLTPADRWAVIAYLRALQLSQHATAEDVPAAERAKLDGARP
jgi:mono/diheme cytochrome c family protein